MRTKQHPFVRPATDGRYEYGLYSERRRRVGRVLGTAPTREAGWEALIGTLKRRMWRCYQGAAFSFGAGVGLLIYSLVAQ